MGNEWMALVVGIVTGSVATTAALFYYAVSYIRSRTISLTFENGAEHGDDSSACVCVVGHVLGERIEGIAQRRRTSRTWHGSVSRARQMAT